MEHDDIKPECIHLVLKKQSDLPYQPFQSFQEGWRYYVCQNPSCGAILKTQIIEIAKK
jgi:hypothetical protein